MYIYMYICYMYTYIYIYIYPPTSLSVERVKALRIIQSNFQSTFNNQQSTNPQPPGLQQAPSTSL